jgi:hypothetical protein
MRTLMFALIGSMVLVASANGRLSAAPADGAAIAKMASSDSLIREAYWRWRYRGYTYRRGRCYNSPARC